MSESAVSSNVLDVDLCLNEDCGPGGNKGKAMIWGLKISGGEMYFPRVMEMPYADMYCPRVTEM